MHDTAVFHIPGDRRPETGDAWPEAGLPVYVAHHRVE